MARFILTEKINQFASPLLGGRLSTTVSSTVSCQHCQKSNCDFRSPQTVCLEALSSFYQQNNLLFRLGKPHDTRYGYELFRRAICEQDELAWDYVYSAHYDLMHSWLKRQSKFYSTNESADYFINWAYRNFFAYFSKEPSRWKQYKTLESLLALLWSGQRNCLYTALQDHSIKEEVELALDSAESLPDEGTSLDTNVFWQVVREHLSEDEYIVLHGIFYYELTLEAIVTAFPKRFGGVTTVYNIRERAFKKLCQNLLFKDSLQSLL